MSQIQKTTFCVIIFLAAFIPHNAFSGALNCKSSSTSNTIHAQDNRGTIKITIKNKPSSRGRTQERGHSPITSPQKTKKHPAHSPVRAFSPISPLAKIDEAEARRERTAHVRFTQSPTIIKSPGTSPSHFPSPSAVALRDARHSVSLVEKLERHEWDRVTRAPRRSAPLSARKPLHDKAHLVITDLERALSPSRLRFQTPGMIDGTDETFSSYTVKEADIESSMRTEFNERINNTFALITKLMRAKTVEQLMQIIKNITKDASEILLYETLTLKGEYALFDKEQAKNASLALAEKVDVAIICKQLKAAYSEHLKNVQADYSAINLRLLFRR